MRRHLATVCAGALALLALVGCSGGKDAVDQNAGGQFRYVAKTDVGKTIPAAQRRTVGPVTGTLLDGAAFRLASYAGKVVVLNFWGVWCPPCRTETPQFDQLYRKVEGSGVQFVGMDVKETSPDAVTAFVHDYNISYPIVYDEKAKTALELGHIPMVGLPATVVVDKQQKVAAVYLGPVQQADLAPVLAELVAEK
jgi:thiol-disulfide isomerase/thioredoxin